MIIWTLTTDGSIVKTDTVDHDADVAGRLFVLPSSLWNTDPTALAS